MMFAILKFFDKHNGNSDDSYSFFWVELLLSHVRMLFHNFFNSLLGREMHQGFLPKHNLRNYQNPWPVSHSSKLVGSSES